MWPILYGAVMHNLKRGSAWAIIAVLVGMSWFNTTEFTSQRDLAIGDLLPSNIALYGGVVLLVYVCLQELCMEMNSKFHLILLSKPISRDGYFLGKTLGVFCFTAIGVTIVLFSAYFFMSIRCREPVPLMANLILPWAHYLLCIWYFSVVATVAGLFLPEAFYIMTIAVMVVMSIVVSLIPSLLAKAVPGSLGLLFKGFYYIAPNIWYFHSGNYVEYNFYTYPLLVLYTLGYTGILLPPAMKRFRTISFT